MAWEICKKCHRLGWAHIHWDGYRDFYYTEKEMFDMKKPRRGYGPTGYIGERI